MSSRKPLIQNKTSNKGRRSCMPQMSHFLPPPRQSKNTIFVISQIFLVKSKLSIVVQNPFAFTNFYKQIFFLHFFTWNDNCQQPYSNERLFFTNFKIIFAIFLVKSKWSTIKQYKTTLFSRIFPNKKKSCIFLVKSKLSKVKQYEIFFNFINFRYFRTQSCTRSWSATFTIAKERSPKRTSLWPRRERKFEGIWQFCQTFTSGSQRGSKIRGQNDHDAWKSGWFTKSKFIRTF